MLILALKIFASSTFIRGTFLIATILITHPLTNHGTIAQITERTPPVADSLAAITVSRETRRFSVDSGGSIIIELSNQGKEDFYFIRTDDEFDFQYELRDKKGKLIPMSQSALDTQKLPRAGSSYSVVVEAGLDYRFSVRLDNFYNLQPGEYSFVAQRYILMNDRISERSVKSKPITIKIRE